MSYLTVPNLKQEMNIKSPHPETPPPSLRDSVHGELAWSLAGGGTHSVPAVRGWGNPEDQSTFRPWNPSKEKQASSLEFLSYIPSLTTYLVWLGFSENN